MKSNRRLTSILWVVPLAITTLACPTRTLPFDGGDGMAGSGGSVDSGTDRGGVSGAGGNAGGGGSGGASGAGVVSGTGGNGGASGVGGVGGAAGSSGANGVGGAAGSSGASGVGGAAGSSGASGVTGAGGNGGVGGASGTVRDGQPCSLAKDCTSGTCTPFYVDVDGDGYGAGQAVGFCGTAPPVGYAGQSGDCCDSASNLAIAKLIHPGADFQTTSAGGVCNITWDYDCSGVVETNPQDCLTCSAFPNCQCVTGNRPESSCGTSGISESTCSGTSQTQSCVHLTPGGGPGTIACK